MARPETPDDLKGTQYEYRVEPVVIAAYSPDELAAIGATLDLRRVPGGRPGVTLDVDADTGRHRLLRDRTHDELDRAMRITHLNYDRGEVLYKTWQETGVLSNDIIDRIALREYAHLEGLGYLPLPGEKVIA